MIEQIFYGFTLKVIYFFVLKYITIFHVLKSIGYFYTVIIIRNYFLNFVPFFFNQNNPMFFLR